MKNNGSAVRVLVVEQQGLDRPSLDGVLEPGREKELVRAGSIEEARALLGAERFDLVIADESRLRGVLDAMFTFVGLFSLGGVVLDVNQAPLAASGLRRDDVVGRRFVELPWFAHSASERARISAAIAAAARGEAARLETRIHSVRNGDLLTIDAAFAPMRDRAGTITHVLGTGVDVTVRSRAEEALASSQLRLAEAQRVAHIGSWEWYLGQEGVSWSDELYRIYGEDQRTYAPTYHGFLGKVHADDLEHTRAVLARAIEAVTPFVYDHRVVRPDGSVRMLHTRGEVIADLTGRAVRLVGSCWDVTDLWEATRRLERSVATLGSTLEATADGILLGDRDGRVAALNQRFLALWGLPPDVGPGTPIRTFADRLRDQLVDRNALGAELEELFGASGEESFGVLPLRDGRVLERYALPQRLSGEICGRVCSFRDVTQRARLLEAAETERGAADGARQAYESILERISDGFVALDRSWRYVYVNGAGGRMLGREARSLFGKHIWTEFPEGQGQKFQRAYEQAMNDQRPVQIRDHYPPWDRWFENRIYPSSDGISIFFTDITAEVRAQEELRASAEQLRALGARLDAIREEERRVIAREIHDQIGQALTALKLDLGWIRGQLDGHAAGAAGGRLSAMDALVDQTIETARRVSATLRPAILDDLGLPAAIAWQAREFEQRTGVRCEVDVPDDGARALAPATALVLFRIVQEALTNVARHAGARQARIRLALEGAEAALTVADDGRGVTAEELAGPTSLGLAGMRERAIAAGGKVTVTGAAGRGTTVSVRVPVADGLVR